jgi:hypothetical protein
MLNKIDNSSVISAIDNMGIIHILDWSKGEVLVKRFTPYQNKLCKQYFCYIEGSTQNISNTNILLTTTENEIKLWNIFSPFVQNVAENAELLGEIKLLFNNQPLNQAVMFYFDSINHLLFILKIYEPFYLWVAHVKQYQTAEDLELPYTNRDHSQICGFDFISEVKLEVQASPILGSISIISFLIHLLSYERSCYRRN